MRFKSLCGIMWQKRGEDSFNYLLLALESSEELLNPGFQ